MLTRETPKKRRKLTRELLGLIILDLFLAVLSYFFLRSAGGTAAYHYCEAKGLAMDALESITLDYFVFNLSVAGAVIIFLVLFLVFVGRKLSYIRKITEGIEALRTHRMDDQVPLDGNNELTELAQSINVLAETERQLKAAEQKMQEEKTAFIRGLSHDIRTPLTAILSYTEYMQSRKDLSVEELQEFLELTKRKAEQIKILTDQLLDNSMKQLEDIENGRLLMEQLAEEWMEMLEENFSCQIDCSQCPNFSGKFDIETLRRIFDNLASNVMKYADVSAPVYLEIGQTDGRIAIKQSNKTAAVPNIVESRGIGLESIRRIAEGYGGNINLTEATTTFNIEIILFHV